MWEKSNCKHDWWYFTIGSYPVLYRRCRVCDRREFDEMPMAVWKYIPTTHEYQTIWEKERYEAGRLMRIKNE